MADLVASNTYNTAFAIPSLDPWSSLAHTNSDIGFGVAGYGMFGGTTRYNCLRGSVVWADGGTHDIRKITWKTATVTAGTGSTLRIALLDPAAAAAGPDGVEDQYVDVDPTTLFSDTVYTHTLAADRTSVAHGTELCVQWRISVFGTSTNIQIAYFKNSMASLGPLWYGSTNSGSTWSLLDSSSPVLVFEAADGTIGTIFGCVPFSAVNMHTFNNTSNPKGYALEFTPNVDMDVVGFWRVLGAAYPVDMKLYAGGTVVSTSTRTAYNQTQAYDVRPITKYTLTKDTLYRLVILPTSANSITAYSVDVSAASHWDIVSMGRAWNYSTLSSTDVWSSPTTTRRLIAGIFCSGAGTSGGGGLIVNPGMNGGING